MGKLLKEWLEVGEQLADALEGVDDEITIKTACKEVMGKIEKRYDSPASRKNPKTTVRHVIETRYPSTESRTADYQYFATGGKGNVPRWEHFALKHLSETDRELEETENEKRDEQQPQQAIQPAQSIQTINQLSIKNMQIEQLELDFETQGIVEKAIEQTGISLADFIQKACQVYAKTITGKTRKHGEDLAAVPTETLLNDAAYSTHPGRADELTRRAIRAIKTYNSEVATEKKQRWVITQSLITELTGSRASAVKAILEDCQTDINDHHQKYDLLDDKGEPDKYLNRKRGVDIKATINLSQLVPDGIE